MAIRNQLKERNIEKVRRERAPMPWQYCLMSLSCAVILAFGFFYAAKQHFSTIEFSMKNSEMRKAKEKLAAEQRKLKAERDEVSSEANIERAGLKIGLKKYSTDDYRFIDAGWDMTPTDNTKPATPDQAKTSNVPNRTDMAKVTRTVSVRPSETDKTQTGHTKLVENKIVGRESIAALVAKK